jgi:hypothetical protein
LIFGEKEIVSIPCTLFVPTIHCCIIMASSKDPNKGMEENASEPQQSSMFDYFRRKKCGRPKAEACKYCHGHGGNQESWADPGQKKQKMQSKQTPTQKSRQLPNKQMMEEKNKPRTNWPLPENKLVLNKAINDWGQEGRKACHLMQMENHTKG